MRDMTMNGGAITVSVDWGARLRWLKRGVSNGFWPMHARRDFYAAGGELCLNRVTDVRIGVYACFVHCSRYIQASSATSTDGNSHWSSPIVTAMPTVRWSESVCVSRRVRDCCGKGRKNSWGCSCSISSSRFDRSFEIRDLP